MVTAPAAALEDAGEAEDGETSQALPSPDVSAALRDAEYYYIPLGPPVMSSPAPGKLASASAPVDLASGLAQPLGARPERMATRELVGPLCSRLNLSNYTTPDVVQSGCPPASSQSPAWRCASLM